MSSCRVSTRSGTIRKISVIVKKYGSLVLGEQGELMVELQDENSAKQLSIDLKEHFSDQVLLAP